MAGKLAIAIETSCRTGSVALGRDDELLGRLAFEAGGRHATQLIARLRTLLDDAGVRPRDVDEVYVSAGPGSFTGLRVGVTAVRTFAQAVSRVRCVSVPTAWVVAENAMELSWEHLGVIMDARRGSVFATVFARAGQTPRELSPGAAVAIGDFLATAPRPILLVGEGLAYESLEGDGVDAVAEQSAIHTPTAENVWRVGRRLAGAGQFTDYSRLLPTYAREPEAVRQWESRQS